MDRREPRGCDSMTRRVGHFLSPIAATALCLLGAVASSASASALKLQLISNGEAVTSDQRSAVIDYARFPGFTCEAFDGAMSFGGGPKRVLTFTDTAEGGDEAFNTCKTESGEEVSTETESGQSTLHQVKVSAETVTETFSNPVVFQDTETDCVWTLRKLSGPLSGSESLTNVAVAGTVKLDRGLSTRTCPKTGEVSGTTTIEAAPEAAPPGSYEVQVLP